MKYVLIYIRNVERKARKKLEVELYNDAELGRFIYNNQPMQVIAVREEK